MSEQDNSSPDEEPQEAPDWRAFALVGLVALAVFTGLYFYQTNNYIGVGILLLLFVILPFAHAVYDDIKYDLSDFFSEHRHTILVGSIFFVVLSPPLFCWLVIDYM
ncbi:MAG: hypothetical protein JSW28_03990, partial [Thermoplasmata archaeon]